MTKTPTVYHIPVCPFSQRVEILLSLKDLAGRLDFHVVDITRPREDWLLRKTRGTTALPVLETEDGGIVKESMVILRYLEERFPDPPVRQRDPYRHAVEGMLCAMEGEFAAAGYRYVMNGEAESRDGLRAAMLDLYARIDDFLRHHGAGEGPYLFEEFGWAETVFTPLFMRFWFLEYYEGFSLPEEGYDRVRAWREACLANPAAQQVTREQIVKLYYDYAKGAGNGALAPGRERSSFAFEPDWRRRPWPPQDKYGHDATDRELGLAV